MAVIRPFRALRPSPQRAPDVASVPYDVVNTEEARALAGTNPLSFLHVSRPEIDLPAGTDPYSDTVYQRAVTNFQALIDNCPLERESVASLYLYRLVMDSHQQTGIAACCSIDEYDKDIIRKHERTRRDKEDDRTRHMLMLRAQTGPVFLTYRTDATIDELIAEASATTPLFDFTAEDGIQHAIWRAETTGPLVEAFSKVPALYIADGHHRAASASRARAALREKNKEHTGTEKYNYFLAVVFPDSQLQILAYNRVVKDLNGMSKADFLEKVSKRFTVRERATPSPHHRSEWCMYLNGSWFGLSLRPDTQVPKGTVASLDVSILQDQLLNPILGIKDIRTDKRIDFVGGLRGTAELERLVNENKAAVAFSLFPTTVEDLLRVSDAGEVMPPKSTWFEPKLRDGLLIHEI
ncbi:MAG: DUF1015 domain-containing protein [Pyrinomonadaceae bacterium]